MNRKVCYEGELIPVDDLGLSTNVEDLASIANSGSFLPRIQLYGGNSEACKEGKITIAHYGLVRDKDRIEDLGAEVEILVVGGRVKAMQIDGDQVITNYDRKSQEFIRISIDSETADSGCMYGPEFLLWIPSAKTFATFFMSSKTARREAGPMSARLGKGALLSAKFIKTKRYSWHGPVVEPLDTPTFDLPDLEEIKKQSQLFLNPKSSGVEKVEAGTQERAR